MYLLWCCNTTHLHVYVDVGDAVLHVWQAAVVHERAVLVVHVERQVGLQWWVGQGWVVSGEWACKCE